MQNFKTHYLSFISLSLVVIGCSNMGNIQGDASRIYSESYKKVSDAVEQGINNRSLSIQSVNQSPSGGKVVIEFSKAMKTSNRKLNNDNVVSGDIAEVIIERIDTGKTKVTVINPDYHYSVSDSEKKKYAKQLIRDVDKILDQ